MSRLTTPRGENKRPRAPARGCPPSEVGFHPQGTDPKCEWVHFWSRHTGGGNWVMADGSVRFLSYSADGVMPALATRSGGEVASGF